MTAIQRNIHRRITLLLVIVCMITGLISPVSCDGFFSILLKFNNNPMELSMPDNSPSIDCIVENATQISFQRPEARRYGYDYVELVSPACSSLFSSAGLNLLTGRFYLFVLLATLSACTLSYFHILFIQQKDGHK